MMGDFDEEDSLDLIACSDRRSPFGTLGRGLEMRRSARRIEPDIIHSPASFTRRFGSGFSKGGKLILTVHDLSFMRDARWFRADRAAYYRTTIRRSVRQADRILVDSEATAIDLSELLNVDSGSIDVIPLGVDARFQPASKEEVRRVRQTYALPDTFCLYLGTLEPRKNIPRIIQAFDRIAGECPHGLVIGGRDGWKFGAIYDAATASRFRERIYFTGFVDPKDLPALLSAAEIFVWPSLWEGFGLPPLEAMACATPVITSNTSSLPEVVGDAALTVTPEDLDAIADAMRSLLSDSALRDRLREQGLIRAREFTWKRTIELTYASYCRVSEIS